MITKISNPVLPFASFVEAFLDCFPFWWISESVYELKKVKKMKNLSKSGGLQYMIFYQNFFYLLSN